MSIHWWDTIAIIPLMVPNYSSYKDWDRTTNGAILPFWVNLSDHLQKSASHNPNSERKKILTSSPETWTYGNTDLAVFVPLVDHFPCENSILLDFYTPRVPTISVPISEVRIQLGLRAVYKNPSLGSCQSEPQIRKVAMCPQVVGENSHFGRGKGKKLSWNFFSLDMTYIKDTFCKKRVRKRPFVSSELA